MSQSSPRVLVLSASVGAGHLRAAEAVTQAVRALAPAAHVENHDVLNFTNGLFRRVYGELYLDLVNRAPHVLGYFYDWLDSAERKSGKSDRLRVVAQKINLRKFTRFLSAAHWDLIINTHFLPAEMIARLRSAGDLAVPQTTVCTDFDTHRLWVNQPCERYFTATHEGAAYLQHWGVPAADLDVTGIPIVLEFAQPADRAACRAAHGIAGDRPVVLQLCGGFGVGPVEEVHAGLLAVEQPLDLVVVCGRNEELRAKLAARPPSARHRVHILGHTKVMHELLAAADVVVSKPGGLTTSEALARGTPLLIVNPIPGQESRNSDYLLERGAALKANHPSLIPIKLTRLLAEPGRLEQMRAAAAALGKPQAAYRVVQSALGLIGVECGPLP